MGERFALGEAGNVYQNQSSKGRFGSGGTGDGEKNEKKKHVNKIKEFLEFIRTLLNMAH